MLREALEISSFPALISGEVARFHGGSFWHSTPVPPVRENNSIISDK